MTPFGKSKRDFAGLAADAVAPLMQRGDPRRVARIYVAAFAPAGLCGITDPVGELRDALRKTCPALTAEFVGPFLTGARALYEALRDVDAGAIAAGRDALVLGCEKMTHVDAATASGVLAPRVGPVEHRYGATLPALAALATRSYARATGVPETALHAVAVKNHRHGALNELAHFREPITADDVAASPPVSDPLRRHHCAPMSDGAAACVLGRDGSAQVTFTGWGKGVDTPLFHDRTDVGRFAAAGYAARKAFALAGKSPRDVGVVEIHDAFSSFELMNLEEMGFFPRGRAWRALTDGALDVGGRLAVNPSGGMKARGHPIGACGISSTVELFAQLTGTAGARQHPRASVGVVQSAGGVSPDTYMFVLEAAK